jgi:hypothetical protein
MMAQAQGYMDVPSEPLGDFYYRYEDQHFVGAVGVIQEGKAVFPFLVGCGRSATTLMLGLKMNKYIKLSCKNGQRKRA